MKAKLTATRRRLRRGKKEVQSQESAAVSEWQPDQQGNTGTVDTESRKEAKTDDEPLNIREDRDSATIYVKPEQNGDIKIMFTQL